MEKSSYKQDASRVIALLFSILRTGLTTSFAINKEHVS